MKETLTLQKGFKFIEERHNVSPYFAYNSILLTKKQKKYSNAEYNLQNDAVTLTRHKFICRNCGAHIPAYPHTFMSYYFRPRKRVPRNIAFEWCGSYPSFFDNKNEVKALQLYTPFTKSKEELTCPYCNHSSKISNDTEEISFDLTRKKLNVSCKINTITEILLLTWSLNLEITSFPLYETICFNFKKHKVYLELAKEDGSKIGVRDITNGLPEKERGSKLTTLIDNNVLVKSKLTKYFEDMWKCTKLPFCLNELNLQKFIAMSKFIGFNKDFYLNIPVLENDELLFDPSFKNERRKLSNSCNCIQIFENSTLPKVKSVKKILFENQKFFFYITEIENFYKFFGEDSNLLVSFLKSLNNYSHLSMLHSHPAIMDFYSDFSKIKSPEKLHKILLDYGYQTTEYALHYASLNSELRKAERKKWNETKAKSLFDDRLKQIKQTESLFTEDEPHNFKLKDQTYNGYTYTLLTSRQQMIALGKHLSNCLQSTYYTTPIIGVVQNGKYIAAIELDGGDNDTVEQAYLANNESVLGNTKFFESFKLFCKKNNLWYYNVIDE